MTGFLTFLTKDAIDEISGSSCAPTDTEKLSNLIAQVDELTLLVRRLLDQTSQPRRVWMEPCELAALLGISTSTLRDWRRNGRFGPCTYRKGPRGYQFHSELALLDTQEANR